MSREAMLLEVIRIVRCHPDFDQGGPMAEMMDQALAGVEHPALVVAAHNLAQGLKPPEVIPFTSKELAQEVLKRLNQDVPNTTVASLKIILQRFVETGKYLDEIGVLIGEQPTPPLAVQRFAAK